MNLRAIVEQFFARSRANGIHPFGRYTDRSRRVVRLANAMASGSRKTEIDVEHLLFGILESAEGMGFEAARQAGVDVVGLRSEIAARFALGPRGFESLRLPTTRAFKDAIDRAGVESANFGDDYVGTEHLIVSLAEMQGHPAIEVLRKFELSADRLRPFVLLLQAAAFSAQSAFGKADAKYRRAIESYPEHATVTGDYAWFLATCPDDSMRDGRRAIDLAQRCCQSLSFGRASCLDTLAAAHAECADFERAIQWEGKAIQLATGPQLETCKERLSAYVAKRPWREPATTEKKV